MNLTLFLLTFLVGAAWASPGDNLRSFKRCVHDCDAVNCESKAVNSRWEFRQFDPTLKLLAWDCYQDCDYQCQRLITEQRKQDKKPVLQFHGKWPFRRVWGIQELASMVFSFGNLIPHLGGLYRVLVFRSSTHTYQTKVQSTVLAVSSAITCLAWLFSTIFHIRDFLLTERLDYYFAGLTVLSGFYSIGTRYFRLYLGARMRYLVGFTALCLSLYAGHAYRLVVDWAYTYNMQANITVAFLQNVILYLLCFELYSQYYYHPQINHHAYIKKKFIILESFFTQSTKLFCLYPVLLSVIVTLGMSLEVFDFPPLFNDLVDAHSLWHLVTIVPLVYGWYDWLLWDLQENVANDSKIKLE